MNIEFNNLLEPYNIRCSEKQLEQFNLYYELLIDSNKRTNLTTITNKNDVIIKHFFDSITPSFYFNFGKQNIIDVGAGAGFPSIPLKILFPDLKITLLDSLGKRITFLNLIKDNLFLEDVTIIHGRAEELGVMKEHREIYDIAIARALARLDVLCELCLPFVKKDGLMIAFKGAKAREEISKASKAFKILGGVLYQEHYFKLPYENGERAIILVKKIKDTPKKYPRKPGDPNRAPII
ncbi:MAG: 16S rRNA (guanine(527)-N(7))-methyltransferase RsmG [Vulcanibacillus sp.]